MLQCETDTGPLGPRLAVDEECDSDHDHLTGLMTLGSNLYRDVMTVIAAPATGQAAPAEISQPLSGHCYGSVSRLETRVLMWTRTDLFRVRII